MGDVNYYFNDEKFRRSSDGRMSFYSSRTEILHIRSNGRLENRVSALESRVGAHGRRLKNVENDLDEEIEERRSIRSPSHNESNMYGINGNSLDLALVRF